jgi:hypothetical protein
VGVVVERFSVLRWGIATMNVNMEVCGNPLQDTHNRIRAVARAEVVTVCSLCVFYEFIFCGRETCCVVNSLPLCSQILFCFFFLLLFLLLCPTRLIGIQHD